MARSWIECSGQVSNMAGIKETPHWNYIPPEARVVLFDSDGTLIGERYPTYSDQCMLVQRLLHDDTAKSNSEDAAFAAQLEEAYLLDVGLIYTMISFIAVLMLALTYIPPKPKRRMFEEEETTEEEKGETS